MIFPNTGRACRCKEESTSSGEKEGNANVNVVEKEIGCVKRPIEECIIISKAKVR